jgi:SAM-dependent methyltransferase
MDYINSNKQAWEEAFENRLPGWGEDNAEKLASQTLPFFNQDVIAELKALDLQGKTIAQFACNNGRELLSAMQLRPAYGIGFDIAENFIGQARQIAEKIGRKNVQFVPGNLLEIDETYHDKFDLIFFTIGAITWFEDLSLLFGVVSKCLKPHGSLLINDYHPFMNMLPVPGEDGFDLNQLDRLCYPYFTDKPWLENDGIGYITPQYHSKTFTSFSHTISGILSSVMGAGISIKKFSEFDYDVGMAEEYNGKGLPLSFILLGEKLG